MERRTWIFIMVGTAALGAILGVLASSSGMISADTCYEAERGSDYALMSCGWKRFLGFVFAPGIVHVLAGIIGTVIGAVVGIAVAYSASRIRRPARAS